MQRVQFERERFARAKVHLPRTFDVQLITSFDFRECPRVSDVLRLLWNNENLSISIYIYIYNKKYCCCCGSKDFWTFVLAKNTYSITKKISTATATATAATKSGRYSQIQGERGGFAYFRGRINSDEPIRLFLFSPDCVCMH